MTRTRKADPRKLEIPIVLLLALILAACGSLGSHEEQKVEGLKLSVDTFNGCFKWEDYSKAAVFVPYNKKELFWSDVDRFKGKIRIVDYQIRELLEDQATHTATAILLFQYWRTDAPIVQTVTFSQKWIYFEKEKRWRVVDTGLGSIPKPKAVE